MIGPFKFEDIPFKKFFISPLTGIWKKFPDKASLIQNLSAPFGNSINSIIPQENRAVPYPSFEYMIEIAYRVGKGGKLWIIDLRNSYFILPILRLFIHLFGAEWMGRYIFYACLPFGLATAPRIFQMFADCLQFIVQERNIKLFTVNDFILFTHYLDDFWGGHPDHNIALQQFNLLFKLLIKLGIPTSLEKCQTPTTCLVILGFLLDTISQTVSIPEYKICEYVKEIKLLLKQYYKTTIKKLEKIGGKLRHCARAMHGGAAFVRGIESRKHFMKYIRNKKDHEPFNLGSRARYDLEFWLEILPKMNYSTPFWFILKDKKSFDIVMYTDASEKDTVKAFGGIDTTGSWFMGSFFDNKFIKLIKTGTKLINLFELVAIVIGIDRNKEIYSHKSILIRCDNECALSWIETQRASFDTITEKYVNIILKYLFKILIKYKIYITGKRIKSKDNTYADNLSRLDPYPFKKVQKDIPLWKPNMIAQDVSEIPNKIFSEIENELKI